MDNKNKQRRIVRQDASRQQKKNSTEHIPSQNEESQQPHREAILSIGIPKLVEYTIERRNTTILSAIDGVIADTPGMTECLVARGSRFYLTRFYLLTHVPQLLIYRYDSEQNNPNTQHAWENAATRVVFDKAFEKLIGALPAAAEGIYPILLASTAIDIVVRQLEPGIEKARQELQQNYKDALGDGNYLLAGMMREAEDDLFFTQRMLDLYCLPAQTYDYLQQWAVDTLDYFRNGPAAIQSVVNSAELQNPAPSDVSAVANTHAPVDTLTSARPQFSTSIQNPNNAWGFADNFKSAHTTIDFKKLIILSQIQQIERLLPVGMDAHFHAEFSNKYGGISWFVSVGLSTTNPAIGIPVMAGLLVLQLGCETIPALFSTKQEKAAKQLKQAVDDYLHIHEDGWTVASFMGEEKQAQLQHTKETALNVLSQSVQQNTDPQQQLALQIIYQAFFNDDIAMLEALKNEDYYGLNQQRQQAHSSKVTTYQKFNSFLYAPEKKLAEAQALVAAYEKNFPQASELLAYKSRLEFEKGHISKAQVLATQAYQALYQEQKFYNQYPESVEKIFVNLQLVDLDLQKIFEKLQKPASSKLMLTDAASKKMLGLITKLEKHSLQENLNKITKNLQSAGYSEAEAQQFVVARFNLKQLEVLHKVLGHECPEILHQTLLQRLVAEKNYMSAIDVQERRISYADSAVEQFKLAQLCDAQLQLNPVYSCLLALKSFKAYCNAISTGLPPEQFKIAFGTLMQKCLSLNNSAYAIVKYNQNLLQQKIKNHMQLIQTHLKENLIFGSLHHIQKAITLSREAAQHGAGQGLEDLEQQALNALQGIKSHARTEVLANIVSLLRLGINLAQDSIRKRVPKQYQAYLKSIDGLYSGAQLSFNTRTFYQEKTMANAAQWALSLGAALLEYGDQAYEYFFQEKLSQEEKQRITDAKVVLNLTGHVMYAINLYQHIGSLQQELLTNTVAKFPLDQQLLQFNVSLHIVALGVGVGHIVCLGIDAVSDRYYHHSIENFGFHVTKLTFGRASLMFAIGLPASKLATVGTQLALAAGYLTPDMIQAAYGTFQAGVVAVWEPLKNLDPIMVTAAAGGVLLVGYGVFKIGQWLYDDAGMSQNVAILRNAVDAYERKELQVASDKLAILQRNGFFDNPQHEMQHKGTALLLQAALCISAETNIETNAMQAKNIWTAIIETKTMSIQTNISTPTTTIQPTYPEDLRDKARLQLGLTHIKEKNFKAALDQLNTIVEKQAEHLDLISQATINLALLEKKYVEGLDGCQRRLQKDAQDDFAILASIALLKERVQQSMPSFGQKHEKVDAVLADLQQIERYTEQRIAITTIEKEEDKKKKDLLEELRKDLNQIRLLTGDVLIQHHQPQQALERYKLISQPDENCQDRILIAEIALLKERVQQSMPSSDQKHEKMDTVLGDLQQIERYTEQRITNATIIGKAEDKEKKDLLEALRKDLNQTRLLSGDILLRQGQSQQALERYRLISQPDASCQDKIFIAEATLFFEDSKYENLKQQCEARLKENPQDILALHYASSACLKLQHIRAAEQMLQAMVSAEPDNVHLYVDAQDKLAIIALRKGFTGQAKQCYIQVEAYVNKHKNKLSSEQVYQELSAKNSEKLLQLNHNIVQTHQQTAAHVVTQCLSGLLQYFLKPEKIQREPDLIPAYPAIDVQAPASNPIKQKYAMQRQAPQQLLKTKNRANAQAQHIKMFPPKKHQSKTMSPAAAKHAAETKAFLATL